MYGKQTRWWIWNSLTKVGIWYLAACGCFSAFLTWRARVSEGDLIIYILLLLVLFYTVAAKAVREKAGQVRLKFYVYLQGTEIQFSISECFHYQAAGGYTLHLNVSFLLVDAIPLEALIIFPTGKQKEEYKTLTVASDEGTEALLPSQVNVGFELDCRSDLPSGKCICCQVIHFLPLGNNYSCFLCKGYPFQSVFLKLASQCTLWLRDESVLWKEGGVVFMSAQRVGRFKLQCATSQWLPQLPFVFCLLIEKSHHLHLAPGKHLAFLNPKGDVTPKHFHFSSSPALLQGMKNLPFLLSTPHSFCGDILCCLLPYGTLHGRNKHSSEAKDLLLKIITE